MGPRWDEYHGYGGNDTFIAPPDDPYSLYNDPFTVYGGAGDDTIWSGDGSDYLDGGSNNDEIWAGGGADTVNGGSGIDEIWAGAGPDTVDGGSDSDGIMAEGGADTVNGGTGDDYVRGGLGDDVLDGGPDNDYVYGDEDNDIITDISGNDRLFGGSGDDTITVRGGELGFDRVYGESGDDTITATGSKVIADGGYGNDTIHTDLSRDTFMIGGDGSDRFVITGAHPVGNGRIAEIHGGDAFVSAPYGSFAGITHYGDTGGVDTLDLSQLPASIGTVNVNLATGTMHNSQGVLLANMTGIEDVVGTSRRDTIIGNDSDNDLRGGGGEDHLNGGRGADLLIGGAGRDTIIGGSGRDRIFGDHITDAAAADTLTGGADSDTFVFVNAVHTTGKASVTQFGVVPASVTDKITDFDTGGAGRDLIDLSAIFDLHARNFNGTAQQAIDKGFIYFQQVGNATKVMFDANGGTHGDSQNNYAIVELDGVARLDLRADHFIV